MADEPVLAEETTEAETAADWKAGLPDEIREATSLKDINDIESLAKGYVHAQSMVGSDKVVIPGKDATQEVKDEFWNQIGRPETSEGYKVPTENMPGEVPMSEEHLKGFFEEAHAIGLTGQQAAALIRYQAKSVSEQMESSQASFDEDHKEAESTLRKEFGAAYDQNLQLAKSAVKKFGGDELSDYLNETGLGNDPRLIKAFAAIGRAVSEDEIIGSGHGQPFFLSPHEAKIAIEAKQRDSEFMNAYSKRNHTGHKGALEEMQRLFEQAHPGGE